MSAEVLYLKIDKHIQSSRLPVPLEQIASILCSKKEIESKVKAVRFPAELIQQEGHYVYSVTDVMEAIWKVCPNLTIENLGESDFILTLEKEKRSSDLLDLGKTLLVCLLAFFGASFSIMAFNNDVDVTRLFQQLYETFSGEVSDGFTVLEWTYSTGVGLGILIFFHHFSRRSKTTEPTPLEVEMRTYEEDVDLTLIEAGGRSKSGGLTKG